VLEVAPGGALLYETLAVGHKRFGKPRPRLSACARANCARPCAGKCASMRMATKATTARGMTTRTIVGKGKRGHEPRWWQTPAQKSRSHADCSSGSATDARGQTGSHIETRRHATGIAGAPKVTCTSNFRHRRRWERGVAIHPAAARSRWRERYS